MRMGLEKKRTPPVKWKMSLFVGVAGLLDTSCLVILIEGLSKMRIRPGASPNASIFVSLLNACIDSPRSKLRGIID